MSSAQSPHQKQQQQRLQQHQFQIPRYPFPPSPPSSANVTAPSSPRIGSTDNNSLYPSTIFDFSPSILAKSPSSRPVSSSSHFSNHRSHKGDSDVSDIEHNQSASYRHQQHQNHDSPRKRNGNGNGKRSHPVRALTSSNSSITSPVQSYFPNTNTNNNANTRSQNNTTKRRSSSSSSSTTSSLSHAHPHSNAPTQNINTFSQSSSSGMNRKVAESLQLFKETTTSPTSPGSEEITGFTFDGRRESVSRKRKQGSSQHQHSFHSHNHHLQRAEGIERNGGANTNTDANGATAPATTNANANANVVALVSEPEFEFVKRSAWPDRENAALRKEKSSNALGLGRVRTRESVVSSSAGKSGGSASVPATGGAKERDREKELDGALRERERGKERFGEVNFNFNSQRGRLQQRRPSAKDLVISDLLKWRSGIEGGAVEDETAGAGVGSGVGGGSASPLISPTSASGTSTNENGRGRQRERSSVLMSRRLGNNNSNQTVIQRREAPPPLPLTPLHYGPSSDSVVSLASVRTVQDLQDLQRLAEEQERWRLQQQQQQQLQRRYSHRDVFSKSPTSISHSSSSSSHQYPPSPSPSRSRTTLRSGGGGVLSLSSLSLSREDQHDIHTSPYSLRREILDEFVEGRYSRSQHRSPSHSQSQPRTRNRNCNDTITTATTTTATTSTPAPSTLSSELNCIWAVDDDNKSKNDYYYYDDYDYEEEEEEEEEDSSNYDFFDSESMISNNEDDEEGGRETTSSNPSPPLQPTLDYLPKELRDVGFEISTTPGASNGVAKNKNVNVNVNGHGHGNDKFDAAFDTIRVKGKEVDDALRGSVSPYTISPTNEKEEEEGDIVNVGLGLGVNVGGTKDGEEIDSMDRIDEGLPHIPLRPFRNQVGGHSAIYKFTKRAVCKPLVSRENLFYEAVEHEAPPLLSFIPRYLGVMLVSYRRVRRSSNSYGHHSLLSGSFSRDEGNNDKTPRTAPAAEFSKIEQSDSTISQVQAPSHCIQSLTKSLPQDIPQVGKRPLGREDVNNEPELEPDTEMLEVALDHNRHIVPEWLLRQSCGIARHSLRHSISTGGSDGLTGHHHNRAHRAAVAQNRGMASTPDLVLSGSHSQGNGRAIVNGHSPLASSVSHYDIDDDGDRDAPTPVNSPNISHIDAHLHRNEASSPPSMPSVSEEDSIEGRPKLHSAASQPGTTTSSSVIFGGTGSTIVNTKLKDHVFGTIMKRFRRRTRNHFGRSVRTDDEANFADGELEEVAMGYGRGGAGRSRRIQRVKRGPVDRLKDEELGGQLRRVQSEGMMSAARERQNEVLQNGMAESDVFSAGFNESTLANARLYMPSPQTRSPSRSNARALPANGINGKYAGRKKESESPSSRQEHFILMEDLTGRLKTPCVLDIKMGTRQYGLDATSIKKKSQRKKCDRTTSRSLGVRVCGMQVWDRVDCSYKTQDKYKGRELHAEDFSSVLASFLYDGRQLMVHHIPGMLQKLYALARIINRLKGYRFYGCSLLFIYDGDGEVQDAYKTCMSDRISSRCKRGESMDRNVSTHRSKNDSRSLRRTHSEDVLFYGADKRYIPHRRKRGEVNIRIVDFAHTTTGRDYLPYPDDFDSSKTTEITSGKGYQADLDPESGLIYARFPPHYPDLPDRGFLFGLKNLAETLVTIWNEERVRRTKLSKDDSSITTEQLPPICTEGKEIFDMIFNLNEGEVDGLDYLST